ncbi:hypothetical protein PFISCL1PPCAC_28480, partial [Pristionchus fissidentatus]
SKQPNHHCEIVCSCGCPYVHIETIFRYIRICIPTSLLPRMALHSYCSYHDSDNKQPTKFSCRLYHSMVSLLEEVEIFLFQSVFQRMEH